MTLKEKICPFCGQSDKTGGAWLESKDGNSEVYFASRKLHLTDKKGMHALCKLLKHKGYENAEEWRRKHDR